MQIGVFDPYSDDPRLAVKKLCLCPITGLLTVAGTAGQVVVAEFSDNQLEKEVPVNMVFSFSNTYLLCQNRISRNITISFCTGYTCEHCFGPR